MVSETLSSLWWRPEAGPALPKVWVRWLRQSSDSLRPMTNQALRISWLSDWAFRFVISNCWGTPEFDAVFAQIVRANDPLVGLREDFAR